MEIISDISRVKQKQIEIMTYAIVNTKGNYRNLNGKRLKVVEQFGNFICCEFFNEGKIIKADFGKSEVVKIWEPINVSEFIGKDF